MGVVDVLYAMEHHTVEMVLSAMQWSIAKKGKKAVESQPAQDAQQDMK